MLITLIHHFSDSLSPYTSSLCTESSLDPAFHLRPHRRGRRGCRGEGGLGARLGVRGLHER